MRSIYSLYLEGYSSSQIAELLTKSGIPTVKGKSIWSSGSVLAILKNEKYCGDALCQKTVTVDFFTHKSVKNNGLEKQYFVEGHHVPIVEKEDWLLAQQIRQERRYSKRRDKRYKPKIVVKGFLAGFAIIDPNWELDELDDIFASLREKQKPSENYIPEEDKHFYIEKE